MTASAVSLRDVSVHYDRDEVLHGVELDVAEGEWIGLIGPNGAGKTTLLKAVAGLVPCDGTVTVAGERPRRRRAFARRVAYVAQDPLVPVGMTVREYVLLGRVAHLGYLAVESRRDVEVVHEVLAQLDLADLAGRPLASLSGGERRRAALARALAQQSPVLLLDEPTTALDMGHQQQALELVERLRGERRLAVISAMHDLTLAGQFADRLLMLSRGKVVASGSARSVLTEGALSEHWGARVRVLEDQESGVVVVPVRSPA